MYPKFRFYVDGLNFYYGVAREYGIKWINIELLLLNLIKEKIPNATVEKIVIFSALISVPEGKNFPEGINSLEYQRQILKRQRQESYLNALKAFSPSIQTVYGSFLRVAKNGIVIKGKGECISSRATIKAWEEKGTDVNLACRIVEDAYISREKGTADYDMCCLVSNDSDMEYALEAKRRLEQRMLIITPRITKSPIRASRKLVRHILNKDRILTIPKKLVSDCQLPYKVGEFTKPREWD